MNVIKLINHYLKLYDSKNSLILFSFDKIIHDDLVQNLGDFEEVVRLLKKGNVLVKIIIIKKNYQKLSEIINFLNQYNVSKVQLIFPEPIVGMEKEFFELIPSVEEAQSYIMSALELLKEKNIENILNDYPFNYKKPKKLLDGYLTIKPIYENKKLEENKTSASVIILTANRKNYLLKVLESFEKQSCLLNNESIFEVVIVDDNSDDGTLEAVKLKDYDFRVVYLYWPREKKFESGMPENRAGPARNLGVKYSNGDCLIFIDGDIVVNSEFIKEHLNSHLVWKSKKKDNQKGIVVIGPAIREKEQVDVREMYFVLCNDEIEKLPIPWAMLHSGNFSVMKKDFTDVGMFDSDFVCWGMEDDEIGYRFKKFDCEIVLNRKAYGIHLWHSTEYVDINNKNDGDLYNATVFYKKHLDENIFKYHLTKLDLNFKEKGKNYYHINLTNNCNNNCVYCEFLGKRNKLLQSNNDIEDKIISASHSDTKILISGGESVLLNNFFEILQKIKYAKVTDVELVTNARAFSYLNFTKKVVKYGVNNFLVTIFGHNLELHDKVTRVKGSYNQTIKGIENLLLLGVNVSIHIVINGLNYLYYDEIIDSFKKKGINYFQITVIPPEYDQIGKFRKKDFVDFVKKIIFENKSKKKENLKFRNDFFNCLIKQKKIDALNDTFDMKKCLFCSFINECRGNPENIFKKFKENYGGKIVFFRNDDVFDKTPKLVKLIDLFITEKVPLNLEIIPSKLTDETVEYLLDIKQKYPYLIDINQHGYSHVEHNGHNEELYEFGKNRSYDEQYHDIGKGKKILEKNFGRAFNLIFTPPFNVFNENTIEVLEKLNFKAISADRSGFDFDKKLIEKNKIQINTNKKIRKLNISVDLIESYSPQIKYFNHEIVKQQIDVALNQIKQVGILFHHELLNNKQVEFVRLLIRKLKKNNDIQFKTISQIINPKILLIQPKFFQKSALICEPTGLLFLAGYLESCGYEVRVFDMNLKGFDGLEIIRIIKEYDPKYIGITAVTPQILNAYKISNLIKKNFPEKIVLFGGVHPTFLPKEAIVKGKADYVILREGETSIVELINAIENGNSIKKLKGIVYKKIMK